MPFATPGTKSRMRVKFRSKTRLELMLSGPAKMLWHFFLCYIVCSSSNKDRRALELINDDAAQGLSQAK